ncbi:hypothetical protein [Streptomyces indicus]|uniref:Uncharacterized protein n=1 Tax=Streptomyces indicus TaxID=417292 RepID=A0A1G9EF97_9ACTN|nr:hypothetical protein [Streptomyces indicus]SDK74802.1 hypothetical protein SAMN05421806_111133 [Streptomyces indicus]
MTFAATLPLAVRRALRPTAVRRALQLALLLGAFLVLGLLCGERAQAAEDPTAPVRDQLTAPVREATQPGGQAVQPVREAVEPVREAAESVREATEPVGQAAEPVRQAAEPIREAAEPVREAAEPVRQATAPARQAVEPVRGVTAPVRQGVAASARDAAMPVQEAAAPARDAAAPARDAAAPVRKATAPVLKTVTPVHESLGPVREAVDSLREPIERSVRQVTQPLRATTAAAVETVTGLLRPVPLPQPALPYVPLPVGDRGADPAAQQPSPGSGADSALPGDPRTDSAEHTHATVPAAAWQSAVSAPEAHPTAQLPHPTAPSGPAHLPVPGGPQGLGAHSTAESGSQRHGDLQGATLTDGYAAAPLSGGPSASTSYDGVRERHRDVLEFPG